MRNNILGATYPVAYAYDAFGRMTAMATTRDSEVDFTALAAELVAGESLASLVSLVSLDTTRWFYEDATGVLTNKGKDCRVLVVCASQRICVNL